MGSLQEAQAHGAGRQGRMSDQPPAGYPTHCALCEAEFADDEQFTIQFLPNRTMRGFHNDCHEIAIHSPGSKMMTTADSADWPNVATPQFSLDVQGIGVSCKSWLR